MPKGTGKTKTKAAEAAKKKVAEQKAALREQLGELDPTIRRFLADLIQATYPGYEYSPKHIPPKGNLWYL